MIPEEKQLRSLQTQLTDLTNQSDSLRKAVAKAEGKLQDQQMQLQHLRDTQEPVYVTGDSGPPNHYAVRTYTGNMRTVPNPARPWIIADIARCQQQIASGNATLTVLDDKIRTIQTQLPDAQRTYEIALANANAASAPVVVDKNPQPLPSPKP